MSHIKSNDHQQEMRKQSGVGTLVIMNPNDIASAIEHQKESISKEQELLDDLHVLYELVEKSEVQEAIAMIAADKRYRGDHGIVSATSLKSDEDFALSFISAVLPVATDIRLASNGSGYAFRYDEFDFAYEFGAPDRFVACFSIDRAYEKANTNEERIDEALQANYELDKMFKTAFEFNDAYETLRRDNVIDENGNLIDRTRGTVTKFAKVALPDMWKSYIEKTTLTYRLIHGFDKYAADSDISFDLFSNAKKYYACILKGVFAIERIEDVVIERTKVVNALREKLVKSGFSLHEKSDIDDFADSASEFISVMESKEATLRDGIIKFENMKLLSTFNVEREKLAVGKLDRNGR